MSGYSGGISLQITGNTAGTPALLAGGIVYLAGGNGITLSQDGQSITISGAGGGGGAITFSAGTTSQTLNSVVFADSNGVSFGLNGSTITASHNGLTSQSNQNVTASNGGFAFQTLSFSNANGLSFGTSAGSAIFASYTVPTVTNSSWTVSDAATSGTVARLAFTNLNGVTLSLSTGAGGSHTIVGSHNGLTSQSNQNITAGNGGFAFQTLSFSNANGISFSTSAGSAIVASHNGITSQSNQQMTLFATSNTTQSSSGTTNASSIIFAGAGIASVGITNGSIVISVPAGGGGGDGGVFAGVSNLGNTAGSTGTVSTGNFVLVGSSGITLSQSTAAAGSDATVTIFGIGDPVTLSKYGHGRDEYHSLVATQEPGNGSIRVFPVDLGNYYSFSKFLASVSLAISTSSNSSHGGTLSVGVGFYSRNGSTLSLATSGLGTYAWTNTSNNSTSVLSGIREVSGTFANMNLTPGDWWVAFWSRTSTVNANWFTASNLYYHSSQTNTTHSGNFLSAAAVASFQPGLPGQGTYSATSNALPVSMAFSHITGTARWHVRPMLAFRNFNG